MTATQYRWRGRIMATVCAIVVMLSLVSAGAAVDLRNDVLNQVTAGAQSGELGTPIDPRQMAASIIQVLLAAIGTIFLVLMVIAGYWFITARGDEEKEKKAMDTIRRAATGLVLVLISYGIVALVTRVVLRANDPDTLLPQNPELRQRAIEERNRAAGQGAL